MIFQFSPLIQAGIQAGKYAQVWSNGVPLSIVRDKVTGQFIAHAIGFTVNNSPLSPLVASSNILMTGLQMYQNQQNFRTQMHQNQQHFAVMMGSLQTIQNSLGVLQATTALIGVGTVTSIALTAVNLYQTMKLRKEVEQMRLEVKNGFVDLKQALKDQGVEIRQLIENVAEDIKFSQHRTVLVRAYGLFVQAINRLRSAMQLQDTTRRNAEIDAARGMLFEALADYTNPHLLEETCAAGQLRRLECSWAIEQAIVTTYQAQNEVSAVSDRLYQLQNKICEDALTVIHKCDSHDELDFLFPELTRIHNHDLAVIESFHNHIDWVKSLSPTELKLLNSADFNNSETTQTLTALEVPPEQLIYENIAKKSHFYSLRDQLLLMFQPGLRHEYENYVSQQAANSGYRTLVTANLQQASDLTVTNLYYYFKVRDESQKEVDNVNECTTAGIQR